MACAKEQPVRADSSSASSPVASSVSPAAASSAGADSARRQSAAANTAACVSEGEWQPCSVEKRLTDAGFVVIKKGASPTDVFQVPGTSYTLGAALIHVYLFPSAKDREKAVSAIDTVSVTRRGGVSSWPMPPTLITSNNLVAVLISDNGRLIERVQNNLTAGLPSAAR
jgi:hypothetical protein